MLPYVPSVKRSPHIALLTANALLGANFSFYASLYESGIEFSEIFLIQIIAGASLFIPFAAILPPRPYKKMRLEDFGTIFTIGLIILFGWLYLLTQGASLTNPIDASTLSTVGPIVTLIIAYATKAEKPNKLHFAATAIALIGALTMLIDRRTKFGGSSTIHIGDAMVAISVVAAAIHTTLARQQTRRYGALVVIAIYFAVGIVVTLPVLWRDFLILMERLTSPAINVDILYITLFGTILPLWLLYTSSSVVSSSVAASYRYAQPLTAIVMTIIRGQANPDDATILGMILIIFGVILLGLANERKSISV